MTSAPPPDSAITAWLDVKPTGSGPLDGLSFGVKDLIDVAGTTTGAGNPTWARTHPPAVAHAVCVEQLLHAGARCRAKTVTDELAFSLLGENHFHGTPLNPRAPGRVPGGSSSGSASAVASGLLDFALGTDTGGSVRVPASNCGIYGLRPSHGLISVAGVIPFAPGFDTVGLLAAGAEVLARAAAVLLACAPLAAEPGTVHLLRDAFDLADEEVRQALDEPIRRLRARFGGRLRETTLEELAGGDLPTWCETYCVIQWAEIRSSLGAWIDDVKPDFGPATAASFALTVQLDRRRLAGAVECRERYYRRLRAALGATDLIVLPTTPTVAPLRGAELPRSSSGLDYYPRALALGSVAGIGRLPQVSLPWGNASAGPVGVSLIGPRGEDAFLLGIVKQLEGG